MAVAQDFTEKKKVFLSTFVNFCGQAEALGIKVAELNAFFNDNGFQTAGANAITDADCAASQPQTTAAAINAGMTALNNVILTAAQKTALRLVMQTPSFLS